MTDVQQREAARQFFYKWNGRGREDEDARSYWIDIVQNIFGVENATDRMDFEKKVVGPDGNVKRIDVYIPETNVLIEQKSLGIALDKPQAGHGGMTPYEQAKMYDNGLIHSEKARWIVTSNFAEIWIYNMEDKRPEPLKLALADLQAKYHLLDFLINQKTQKISDEMRISLQAGELVGVLYDAFLKQYRDPNDPETLKSLNKLCVRIVFCLYAEDAGLFGRRNLFHDYMAQFDAKAARKALRDLFRVLDQDMDERDPYLADDDPLLAAFPYVNGGLFADEAVEIPPFTDELLSTLLNKASGDFDWSEISPTIFGAVFESTLNPETRRSGGMHYTSVENIHKVIDPLFLDDLKAELAEISAIQVERTRVRRLNDFRSKLATLEFLDPAAGSGNFLTESYICLRRLENDVLRLLSEQIKMGESQPEPIKVSIGQFHGIEINDFAVTVAKTALWISESQMMKETEDIIFANLDFLPLKTNANIVEGNALRMDWNEVVPKERLNYIMGNPPFVGYSLQSKEQKEDILSIYVDENGKPYKTAGKIDYVSGWYFKAAQLIEGTSIRAAFVSTNSITQGEQVAAVWKPLYERFGIHIDFAYRTFRWDSEANIKAHVHCVIVGFSTATKNNSCLLFDEENEKRVSSINAYLIEAPDLFISSRNKPVSNVPDMVKGSSPVDGGNLLLSKEELEEMLSKDKRAEPYIKPFMGAREYIHSLPRYCLWLVNASPSVINSISPIKERVHLTRDFRLASTKEATRKYADYPARFMELRQPDSSYILIPRHSSENRRYIPFGFMSPDIICGDANNMIPDASMYMFGILTSNVHMAWMRAICGRIKSDYRYSNDVVYNNFPWPDPTPEQKAKIEQTAQGILDARALYPDCSLADLYDELTMPPELRRAHQANDRAVMQAYGFDIKNTTEASCVAELMKRYQALTADKPD